VKIRARRSPVVHGPFREVVSPNISETRRDGWPPEYPETLALGAGLPEFLGTVSAGPARLSFGHNLGIKRLPCSRGRFPTTTHRTRTLRFSGFSRCAYSPAGGPPGHAATDFSGKLLFVVNFISNSISVFTIGSGGGLTGSPVPTDSNPISVAVDRSGSSVYVVNLGGGTVNVFAVGTSDVLTLASSTPTGQARLSDVLVI
jgi:DNA-binding beta-propeller fold protein YncE